MHRHEDGDDGVEACRHVDNGDADAKRLALGLAVEAHEP
jgi:hypothetical protein